MSARKLKPVYSGKPCRRLWKRIERTGDPALYSLACALQSVEWQLSIALYEVESKILKAKKGRKK